MKEMATEQIKTMMNDYTGRAVQYVLDFETTSDFAVAIRSRPVSQLLDLNDDNPVGWSFYFLKQIIQSITA